MSSQANYSEAYPGTSSSSHSPAMDTPTRSTASDERDEIDYLDADDAARILADDPVGSDLNEPLTFKRKPKSSPFLAVPVRIFHNLTGGAGSSSQSRSRSHHHAVSPQDELGIFTQSSSSSSPPPFGPDDSSALNLPSDKDGSAPLDWHVEGPGRRVGYENLTAIDWIFEYTKERQRVRILSSSARGLAGYLQRLLDASQPWIILLLTGMLVGILAAAINIAADWLGDMKLGYCSTGPEGGHFYLSRSFCCYGYDQGSKCAGWRLWAEALGVQATGGRWFLQYFFYLLFSTSLAFCATVLVQEYAPYAKHSGIPEIKTVLGGFVIRKLLGTWTLVTKSLGLVLATSSGLWLGKEGPLVHVACCCANLFTKLFTSIRTNEARKREVLSAAAASGISVAFGSPIGGVLFSLEQLSYYFPDKTMWQSFVCAMTAAVVLQGFDPFRSGKLVLYQTKYTTDWHDFEIVPYAILGIFGGLYGGLFIKANMFVAQWKKTQTWLPSPEMQVLAVALLTGLVNYPNYYMKVQSTELVSALFAECSQVLDDQLGLCRTDDASARTITLLLFAAVLGFFLSVITFGLHIPAGIILPSMAIGALVGRAVGIIMEIWVTHARGSFPFSACEPDLACVTPGTYAIIGAAAALAGVTRMTVSIVVIMFELTGALTYVLPIMVAVMISKWVGDAFSRRGIYESWIHFNEYPFLDNNSEETAIPDVPASQIVTRIEDLVVLTATGHTISSLHSVLEMHAYRGFPVVTDPRDAILLGYISRADLLFALRSSTEPPRALAQETEAFFSHQPLADPRSTLDLRPWMDQTPLTLPARTNLHLVATYFQKLGLRYVLFSDRGVLQGLLTKKDVWYVLNGAEETRRTSGLPQALGPPTGVAREDGDNEQRGLLRGEEGREADEIENML